MPRRLPHGRTLEKARQRSGQYCSNTFVRSPHGVSGEDWKAPFQNMEEWIGKTMLATTKRQAVVMTRVTPRPINCEAGAWRNADAGGSKDFLCMESRLPTILVPSDPALFQTRFLWGSASEI
jgi:hypothetical protein